MKEDISSRITKIIGRVEADMLIQILKSSNIQQDVQMTGKSIKFPITSLQQLSCLNTQMEALRAVARKTDKSRSRSYSVKLDKQGNASISLKKTTDSLSFFDLVMDFFIKLMIH